MRGVVHFGAIDEMPHNFFRQDSQDHSPEQARLCYDPDMIETNRSSFPLDLQEKLLRIDENKRGFTTRRVTNIGKALGLAALNELRDQSSKHLTPSFIADKRRKRKEKEEEARQVEARRQTQIALDEKLEAARIAKRKTVQAQLNAQRRITQSAATFQRAHALKDSHRCQELSQRLADRDDRNDEQRKDMERRRAAAQAAEAKRVADAEVKRRREAAAYWSQQAKILQEEAEAIRMKTTMGSVVEATPIIAAATEKRKAELPNHPQSTMFQGRRDVQRVGDADADNCILPLFSTKQPYGSELSRAKMNGVEALQVSRERKLSDLEVDLGQVVAKEAALDAKEKSLQSSLESHEQKINSIVAGLQVPYPREPNAEQRVEMHCLKSSISKAKRGVNSVSIERDWLAKRKTALIESIHSMKSDDFIEEIQRKRREILINGPKDPPMVIGRRLDSCDNLGESPNPSAMLKDVITRSKLELQRNALPSLRSMAVKRRENRRIRDRSKAQEDCIQNLISDRAGEIKSLSRQLWKKRREALNKDLVAFSAAGKSLRKVSSVSLTRGGDNDHRLVASMADFDRRKLARDARDFIDLAPRGSCLGDEHCIYDLNAPSGIHKMICCHRVGFDDDDDSSDSETSLLEERRIQGQRKAAYGDNIDFVGRIQGFRKKLQVLESSQTELRQQYAEAVDIVHKRRRGLETKGGGEITAKALEEAENRTKELKRALLNLSAEIQTKHTAMWALTQKYHRYQRLMLRRSMLSNDHFFPRERHRTIMDAFGRWRFYKDWSIGTKVAVERKREVLVGEVLT